jgi:hypothetical protein
LVEKARLRRTREREEVKRYFETTEGKKTGWSEW